MEEEDAVLKLPVDQQWGHTKWNARQNAYKLIAKKFDSAAPDDPCFSTWAPRLKSAATDSNVIALEAGLKCISAFAKTANPSQVDTLRASIAAPMAEKALPAAKSSVKTSFQQACQDLAEGSATPAAIIDDLIPTLGLKNPKAVAASIINLRELYVNFGRVMPLKGTLGSLPALYAHTDKTIRAEASNLSVVLAQVGGKAIVESALANIKPVQLKEIQPKLENAEPLKPLRIPRVLQVNEALGNEGVEGQQGEQVDNEPQELDPYDMAEEVQIKKHLPDISAALGSVKWKERKEALESVEEKFNGVMRIAPDDFGLLASQLARVVQKDANLMCVTSAMNITKMLASGLRKNFTYAATLVPPIVERFKEKKATAVESAVNAVQAIYTAAGLDAVLPAICTCLGHKAPQVRIESSKFLVNLLSEIPTAPNTNQLKEISEPATKNMTDTQEPVRAEAAKILAVLVKLVGKAMNPALSKLDDMRKQKVTDAAEHVSVKLRSQAASKAPQKVPTSRAAAPVQAKPAQAISIPSTIRSSAEHTRAAIPPQPRGGSVSQPVTSTPQKQPRPIHSTDFTPVKQDKPLRRRLGSPERQSLAQIRARSPERQSVAQIRARSPLRAQAPRLDQPDESSSRHSPHQSPLATLEVDMLRREKLLAVKERDLLRKNLDQERTLRENAERQVIALREDVARLRRELNRSHSANNSLDGSNTSLDYLNNRMSSMNINDDSFEKLSSRPITLGAPRVTSRLNQADDELRAKQHEKSRENWRRAAEVTSSLKKRVEEMKRTRMTLQQDSEI